MLQDAHCPWMFSSPPLLHPSRCDSRALVPLQTSCSLSEMVEKMGKEAQCGRGKPVQVPSSTGDQMLPARARGAITVMRFAGS